ncbi:MAG: hypothetical protein M1840_003651 [Geoglossum simile]|nr:MAG: hypothetical protein M1840_003651 [Geoglossum simile]
MGTELYRTRRAPGAPRPIAQEHWQEHVHPFAQIEGLEGKSRWVPAISASSRIPASLAELESLVGGKWRQFEPPMKELTLVEVGTPPEICKIIRESLENQVAARQRYLHEPEPSIQETETDHDSVSVDLEDGSAPPAPATTPPGPSESQHMLQDSSSSSTSALSGVRSNGSSVRNARLTPSTSRSSNSSRGTQNRNAKPQVQKNEVIARRPLPFVPFFGALPASSRATGPHQASPRAAQIKKFWNDRMSDGTALMDESYFPPRCCVIEIPIKVIQGHLSFRHRALYKRKVKEYAVPAGERLFCPHPTCARWNPPSKKAVKFGAIKCRYCRRKICFTCKGKAHETGADCPQDFALEATMQQAQRSGWRRCFRCKNMVEKQSGCIHITCNCKAEWCYTCGAQWKTCSCTEEDEVLRHQALERQANGEDEEAREIAAAIADIERQEHEEMERASARGEAEARETARRQEARLRTERLQTESERRRRNRTVERAERIEVRRLRAIADELEILWMAFHRVHRMQRKILLQHHAEARSELALDAREAEAAYSRTLSSVETAFRTQHSELMQELRALHGTVPRALQTRQQIEGGHFVSLPFRSGASREQDAERSGICTAYPQPLRVMQSSATAKKESAALDQQVLQQVADIIWFEALVGERSRMLEDLEARIVSPPPNTVAAARAG